MDSRSVAGGLAAIDVQDLAGYERRRLQKQDSADHVLDLAHTADWVEGREEFVSFRRVHRGLDDPG